MFRTGMLLCSANKGVGSFYFIHPQQSAVVATVNAEGGFVPIKMNVRMLKKIPHFLTFCYFFRHFLKLNLSFTLSATNSLPTLKHSQRRGLSDINSTFHIIHTSLHSRSLKNHTFFQPFSDFHICVYGTESRRPERRTRPTEWRGALKNSINIRTLHTPSDAVSNMLKPPISLSSVAKFKCNKVTLQKE